MTTCVPNGGIAHAIWFATPENDWTNLFHGNLPEWLVINNTDSARDFYKGIRVF